MKNAGLWILVSLLLSPVIVQAGRPEPLTWEGTEAPFKRRLRKPVVQMQSVGRGLLDLERWPGEPLSPPVTDPERFATAFRNFCGRMPPKRGAEYAGWIMKWSNHFDVDPFLLGAVIYRMSKCRSYKENDFGVGLGGIDPQMHRRHFKDGKYLFHTWIDGAWQQQILELPAFRPTWRNFRRPESGIYFTAALLAIARAQCPHNDGAFGSVPHRHFVSHYVWGDRVKGAGAEDRMLVDRRRLIIEYTGEQAAAEVTFESLKIRCPLDGQPRKVSSLMGDDRDQGIRRHRGIDFESTTGEPVRAIADGVIVFAGVDKKEGRSVNMKPKSAPSFDRSKMGAGGLLVRIHHGDGLDSLYMHLDRYTVVKGQMVKAGDKIGEVGRSGIKRSVAHLHFELRRGGQHINPMDLVSAYVFSPLETYLGQRVARKQRRDRGRRYRARIKQGK